MWILSSLTLLLFQCFCYVDTGFIERGSLTLNMQIVWFTRESVVIVA